jgi:hypothetical protein
VNDQESAASYQLKELEKARAYAKFTEIEARILLLTSFPRALNSITLVHVDKSLSDPRQLD